MDEQMEFPETFEKFAEDFGFKDDKEVYTNGIDLIPIFRVKQWLEHDTKLPQPKTGQWIYKNGIRYCEFCGASNSTAYANYCPNCGSVMKGEIE